MLLINHRPPSKHLGRETDDPNPPYTEEEKRNWRENPEELKKYRKGMIHRTNKAFKMVSAIITACNE